MPRQGLVPRSRIPHSSPRNIIARRISSAQFAALGRSLLAASNHAATSCASMQSNGSDIETTARYAHLAQDSIHETAERIAESIAADIL